MPLEGRIGSCGRCFRVDSSDIVLTHACRLSVRRPRLRIALEPAGGLFSSGMRGIAPVELIKIAPVRHQHGVEVSEDGIKFGIEDPKGLDARDDMRLKA
jgi:hypothetical protein